jgi:two-component sensor histidine kinase
MHPDDNAETELAARLRQQAAVAELGQAALRGLPLLALLDEAARLAAEGLGAPLSKVLEHLREEDALLVRAGVGWREGVVGHARLGTDTASPAGFALKVGAPVISNHLAGEARFRTPRLLADHGVRRAVNVVVAGEAGPAFGVLEADSRDPGEFSEHDIAFLQALANTLGLAIDRARDAADREALLAEKDLLMREVHHRVKNSLQVVQSILSLQARAAEGRTLDPGVVLREAVRRVATIAAVHDRLYRVSGNMTDVPIRSYLEGLVGDLAKALSGQAGGRALHLAEASAVSWPAADVAPLGLVLTELVTNALKYGAGTVTATFWQEEDGRATLTVADEGTGLPVGFDPGTAKGLGLRLVRGLMRGRGGLSAERDAAGRTRFVAVFNPAPRIEASPGPAARPARSAGRTPGDRLR